MTRTTTVAAAAALVIGLSGAALAQQTDGLGSSGTSVGGNAAGSKSGVVGRGDSMEGPSSTGTTMAPSTGMQPGTMRTDDPAAMPRTGTTVPAAR